MVLDFPVLNQFYQYFILFYSFPFVLYNYNLGLCYIVKRPRPTLCSMGAIRIFWTN